MDLIEIDPENIRTEADLPGMLFPTRSMPPGYCIRYLSPWTFERLMHDTYPNWSPGVPMDYAHYHGTSAYGELIIPESWGDAFPWEYGQEKRVGNRIVALFGKKSADGRIPVVLKRRIGLSELLTWILTTSLDKYEQFPDEVYQWGNERELVDFSQLSVGRWMQSDYTCCCENCGETVSSDETTTVNTHPRRGTAEWCESCRGDDAFECERQNEYYSRNNFAAVTVDGETICYQANDDELYHWGSDGEYHWEPEEEEEEEEQSGGQLPGYHSSPKPWKREAYGKALLFGCELELYATGDRADVLSIANDAGLFAERDGSLDGDHGIEVIGKPWSLEYHQDPNAPWLQFLKRVRGNAKGWNAGKGYGIHVSINRHALTDFQTGKLLVFIHHNKSLCERVAGREENRWQVYGQKKIANGKNCSGDRYEALAIRDSKRLELRIFRSTTKPEGFLRAVEFTASAVAFVRDASADRLTEMDYVQWLARPENQKTYRNILVHLGIKTVTSGVRTVRKSAQEITLAHCA